VTVGNGEFIYEDVPTTDVDRREAVTSALAEAVRDLVDATIRTTVDDGEVERVRHEVAGLVERLRVSQVPGPAGVRYNSEGRSWHWGNAVVGARNAVAPPLLVVRDASGLVHAEVELGAAYEGPPGLVHGGVAALLLDHVMGATASSLERVTYTGTLTTRFRGVTPLGAVRLESRIDRAEGRKVFVVATLSDATGRVTVEADGVFIQPAWSL
jgi:acyl-coenzyme A thioesterase PaaI-like protein